MKILHALEYSVPRLSGYTIRSKYIVENQFKDNLSPIVVTSPLHEKTDKPLTEYEEINSIRYYRTGKCNKLNMNEPIPLRLIRRFIYSRGYGKAIQWVAKNENAQVIHAHSSYLNGTRANQAAKKLGIPSVYEVRGFWHDTAIIDQNIDKNHWKYRFVNNMDKKAMLEASAVITISKHLKSEIEDRGVKKDRAICRPKWGRYNHLSTAR